MKNKDKRGASGIAVTMVILMSTLVIGLLFVGIMYFTGNLQGTVSEKTTEDISKATSSGDVAQIKVRVRDRANTDPTTRLAVPVYCKDELNNLVIDGTTSSTTSDTSGSTTRGKTVTCWAFNSTIQTVKPITKDIDSDIVPFEIDAYTVATTSAITFYNDQFNTGTGGVINVTGVGANIKGTLNKVRVKNNQTSKWLPIGGVYFDVVTGSNVSSITVDSNGLSISDVTSTLATGVTTRKEQWNYVFEFNGGTEGTNKLAVILEDGDYKESGAIGVKGNGNGCVSAGELISSYGFTKGYYRSISDTSFVKYGHETDAESPAVVSTSITGETFYCTNP